MATIVVTGSAVGNAFSQIMAADDIQPGFEPSYELCKLIYTHHVLGRKLADKPIDMAQSQPRKVTISDSPEDDVRDAFENQWRNDGIDGHLANLVGLSRVYGIASLGVLEEGTDVAKPIDLTKLWDRQISFNVFDPLNTAGSLVLNQNPNAMDFQHVTEFRVGGRTYHRSRSSVVLHEKPIYIQFTTSAYGFVGRSVYQRTLFPLKSYLQTMVTNDLVTKKAGLLVAMMKAVGSVIDNVMASIAGQKREMLKQGMTGNVLTIDKDERIETLNMQNTDVAMTTARTNILHDIAAGADMPAKIMTMESFAEGFGEGSEDAREVAQFVKRIREEMARPYAFMDRVTQHRAWNPEFYASIQRKFSEYRSIPYDQAFYRWQNSFKADWPSFIEEPDSEKIKVDDVKLKAIIAFVQVLDPMLDPENKATLVEWACDNLNEMEFLFTNPLLIDPALIAAYEPPQPAFGGGEGEGEGDQPKHPIKLADAMDAYGASVRAITQRGARGLDEGGRSIYDLVTRRRGARR